MFFVPGFPYSWSGLRAGLFQLCVFGPSDVFGGLVEPKVVTYSALVLCQFRHECTKAAILRDGQCGLSLMALQVFFFVCFFLVPTATPKNGGSKGPRPPCLLLSLSHCYLACFAVLSMTRGAGCSEG